MQLMKKKWAFGHKTLENTQKWPKNPIFCTYKNHFVPTSLDSP